MSILVCWSSDRECCGVDVRWSSDLEFHDIVVCLCLDCVCLVLVCWSSDRECCGVDVRWSADLECHDIVVYVCSDYSVWV